MGKFIRILLLALSLGLILAGFNSYQLAFRIIINDDLRYKLSSLQEVYAFYGQKHNLSENEIELNDKHCQYNDYYKLTHPDTIYEDVYCFHRINDAVLRAYQKDCFSISHHSKAQAQLAKQKQTVFHGNPTKVLRQKFMTQQCIFIIDISLDAGDIDMKSVVQERLKVYEDKLHKRNASAQCISDSNFYPISYALNEEVQCQKIFQILLKKFTESNSYPEYLIKSDIHLGLGLNHIDHKLYNQLRRTYNDSALCGKILQKSIIQEMIKKPALINGHKLDFRVWILIVQADPLIIYVYDYTVILTCIDPYNPTNLTQYNFNCNAVLAKAYWYNNKTDAQKPLNLDQIHEAWTFQDWGRYFKKQGLVDSDEWWQTTLLPLMEMKIAYFMKIMLKDVLSDQRLSGLYAFDATIDTEMNLKLFEINVIPNFHPFTTGNVIAQKMLHTDAFKLLRLYLQQRYVKFINHMNNYMIPRMKQNLKVDIEQLGRVMQIDALPQKKIQQFWLIDLNEAYKNCKPYNYD